LTLAASAANHPVARAVPADYKENGGVSPWAIDPILADRLWLLSEELTSTTLEV
jgi:hypothetical protein